MSHFVFELEKGGFMAHRKTVSLYKQRTPQVGVPLEEARVFTSSRSAQSAANGARPAIKGRPIPVSLVPLDYIPGKQS